MTERAENADFRRKPQILADSPLLLEIQAFGGRRKPQKTADFRRKPKIFAGNRRLGSVTSGASPLAHPYVELTEESASMQYSENTRFQNTALGDSKKETLAFYRVHAKGVVLCERTCFCLLSTF